jgi:hypothetical protein
MAVVQISRIQVRRGKASSGTGLPQLASGELAWAIDNQQLFIGNGSVAEGSPAVGNTKILTENDLSAQGNILNLIQHIYRSGDNNSVQTGPTLNTPIERTLQARLDDRVTLLDFGAYNDGTHATETTAALQRAIDQLYLNATSAAHLNTAAGTQARVTLEIPAGTYAINGLIYVPSYATLVGAGADSTRFMFTGNGHIRLVNDNTVIGTPSTIDSTSELNQPKFITIKNMSLETTNANHQVLILDAVADSKFENLVIQGPYVGVDTNDNCRGIELRASPSVVAPSQRNIFDNITIFGFKYGVFAKEDIFANVFKNFHFGNDDTNGALFQGFAFGNGSIGTSIGTSTGPIDNVIENCFFKNIKRQAIYIERGTGNSVSNCKVEDVGNDGGGHSSATYPQVFFKKVGNFITGFKSDRPVGLGDALYTRSYVPEVAGHGEYQSYSTRTVNITSLNNLVTTGQPLFRLPMPTDEDGVPTGSIQYQIEYVYRSTGEDITRVGTMTVLADKFKTYIPTGGLQLSDEYSYVGDPSTDTELQFIAVLHNQVGGSTTGDTNSIPHSIAFYYVNPASSGGVLQYSYRAIF